MAVQKKCLGIDLGTNSIKVAEMAIESDGLRILKTASTEISLLEEASRASRVKATVNALKSLLKENKIGTKEAIFCVSGQTVFVRRFRLPQTTQERLKKIINYEARQQIPFPIDKTMLEYQIFPIKDAPEVDVFLVALKKDVLLDFMEIVNKTALKPIGISVSTLALYNFYSLDSMPQEKFIQTYGQKKRKISFGIKLPKLKKKRKKKKGKAEKQKEAEEESEGIDEMEEEFAPELVRAYVHIGSSITDLSIGTVGENPFLGFTRSIPIAGNTITQHILENCDNVKEYKEAERIKRENTVILSMDAEPGKDVDQEASEAATATVDKIIAELRRSLDFYISQPDGMAVDEIVLTGGQTQIPNLDSYIEEKLGIEVHQLDILSGDNFKGLDKSSPELTKYPISIGLASLGLGVAPLKIDFLPTERKVAIKFKHKRGFVLALAAMVAGTIILGGMCGDHYITIYQDQTYRYQDLYRKNLPMINRVKKATEVQKDLKEKFDKLARGLIKERDYPLRKWVAVLKAKPAEVLVSSLQIFPNGKIQIDGFTEDMNAAVTFTSNLNNELKEQLVHDKEGKGAKLKNIKTEYSELFKKDVSKFTIIMKIKDRRSRITRESDTIEEKPTDQRRRRAPQRSPMGEGMKI